MELGESLEATAAREVKEEVGLICRDFKLFNVYSGSELYYKYPDGNEVYNVTATYICKNFSGEIQVDKNEGKDAQFFHIENIPERISPPVRKIINELVLRYKEI